MHGTGLKLRQRTRSPKGRRQARFVVSSTSGSELDKNSSLEPRIPLWRSGLHDFHLGFFGKAMLHGQGQRRRGAWTCRPSSSEPFSSFDKAKADATPHGSGSQPAKKPTRPQKHDTMHSLHCTFCIARRMEFHLPRTWR